MNTPLPIDPFVDKLFTPEPAKAGFIENPHKPDTYIKIPLSKGIKVYHVQRNGEHRLVDKEKLNAIKKTKLEENQGA